MEIQTRTSRHSPKVDLTAMVDLGFLLITFFMLATTMYKPKVMQLMAPAGSESKPVPESKSMILMLGTKDKIYSYLMRDTYVGTMKIDSFYYGAHDLREKIMLRQQEVEAKHGNKEELFVLIKPLPGSSYKNLVDVLDEMSILQVKRFAIVKADTDDDLMVKGLVNEE